MTVPSPQPRINAIATAVPDVECDASYHAWAQRQLEGRREATLLDRMLQRSGIGRRFTVLPDARTRVIAHVGDSRAYLLREGVLKQITTDHTWVQKQVELGKLSPRRARVHPYSSVLTHALGVPDEERIDTLMGEVREGDVYLLCTDGLTTVLEDDTIEDLLRTGPDLPSKARDLIDAANHAGGPDNITVVLIRATDVGDASQGS